MSRARGGRTDRIRTKPSKAEFRRLNEPGMLQRRANRAASASTLGKVVEHDESWTRVTLADGREYRFWAGQWEPVSA